MDLRKKANFKGSPPADRASVEHTLAQMMADDWHTVIVVDDGDVVGAAGIVTSPRLENHAMRTALTLFLWTPVRGRELISGCENWLRERGLTRNSLSTVAGMRTEATARFYRMLGYTESERMFVKEL